MADTKGTGRAQARGLQKTHKVTNLDGSTETMTQAAWKNRDKSLGQTRPDDAEAVEPVLPVEETPEEPVAPTE